MKRPHPITPLRLAAQAQLARLPRPTTLPTKELLHELQVHQIELEMQNEELRRAHVALDTERARYFDLYDLAPVGYLTVSEQGLVLQSNFTACSLLGVARGALLQQAFSRYLLPEDADIFYLLRKKILTQRVPQSCELRMLSAPGQPIWLHLAINLAHDEHGAQVLRIALSDISARMLAEAALSESEAFSLAILNSVTAQIAVLNRHGVILVVNETWRRFSLDNSLATGQPAPHTLVGANYLAACRNSSGFLPKEAVKAWEGIQSVLDGGQPVFSLEYPCHSPHQQRWFSMSVTPMGTQRRGVVISHTDITERMLAEADLRVAAAAFECQEGFAVLDENFNILRANQAFTRITGFTPQEAKGQSRKLLRSDRHPTTFYDDFWRDESATGELLCNMWMRRKNGQDFLAQVGKTAIKNAQNELSHYVVNFTDITQHHQKEEQRLHRESVHRNALVREVHHRIKNNLQGITGLLRRFAATHPETAEPINQAISQVLGISVIHGLQGQNNTSAVRLCELIQAIAAEAQVLWQTQVVVDIEPTLRPRLVAEKEAVPIALILNELVLNAVKHGGRAQGLVSITLGQSEQPKAVSIGIRNAGPLLPEGAATDARHSGLKLISALMPPQGASISRQQQGTDVITLLQLAPPVIFFEP